MAHSRQFFYVELEHEDLRAAVGPFSSIEAARRWQQDLIDQGFWEGTDGSSSVIGMYGPVEAEVIMSVQRAKRKAREGFYADPGVGETFLVAGVPHDPIPTEDLRADFGSSMGHPGGHYG